MSKMKPEGGTVPSEFFCIPITEEGTGRIGVTRSRVEGMIPRQLQYRDDLIALRAECNWAAGYDKMDPSFHPRADALALAFLTNK